MTSTSNTPTLDKVKELATNTLIDLCATHFKSHVLKDKPLQGNNTSIFLKEFESLKREAARNSIPNYAEEILSIESEIFDEPHLVSDSLVLLHQLKKSHINEENIETVHEKIKFLSEYISGFLALESKYVFALAIDKIAKEISKDFDSNKFNDKDYIVGLIDTTNRGYPFLFAGQDVKDDPTVVIAACQKAWWYFDMASERLKKLSLTNTRQSVLERDLLRCNLEKSLSTTKDQQKNTKI